ncbi:Peroxisomal membrane signal receptor PTS1 [Saccharomyces cerevisiae]|nr:Pex5p [Saccharomyces cerevisiae YJM326]AJU69970.1 Pex5p [Saccharomyces cerevisiae YJM555]AJU72079.1 Pex5p [Saccharomyces cerevisiae YJM682]AJU73500.1 Pex5p [Saccharomyces cerevisiae YJM689]AJV01459.1 Pex5p [Saccharomyces cerevisiae YJM1388]AJV02171.1 Pex5p [Saccharomyces cerevisiae YJM1389]AJV13267.1 Pex5p [Saccharomyces cerevisiae YJM1460]AJV20316.1 Pex5p [Saccharomyces cerevisiae YJM1592]KZV12481.1 PEX5 [Saccharomyces cerevisiae]
MDVGSCSVGNNPLAQLHKHTQQNKSLQFNQKNNGRLNESPLQGTNKPGINEAFISNVNAISQENMANMQRFINGEPLIDDKRRMEIGPSSGRLPPFSNVHSLQTSANPTQIKGVNDISHWSQEFQGSNSIQNRNTDTGNSEKAWQRGSTTASSRFQYPNTMMNNYAYASMNSLSGSRLQSPAFMNQQQSGRSKEGVNEQEQQPWTDQFEKLEKEVSENLDINDEIEKEENVSEVEQNKPETVEKEEGVYGDQYQSDFQEVWDSIHKDAEEVLPSELVNDDLNLGEDYLKYLGGRVNGNIEYAFQSNNEYFNNPNAYKIGCLLMENGAKLSEAALAFEAAVKEKPDHVDAWLRLGLVQTQNEKELNGISALEECLKLDPKNLEAMKTLAISYINEGYDMSAFTMLDKWAETKYPEIWSRIKQQDDKFQKEKGFTHIDMNAHITKQFLQLANNLSTIDPEIQLCLGLLFYTKDDFDKTIDCFESALRVNPNDELMWNRLGASLANSNRSEEAIQAYHRALQLKPSFVRARYNLAVSSMNIGCFKEAAGYLLSVLSMHEVNTNNKKGDVGSLLNTYNDTVIETLKRVFIAMNRDDLLQEVKPGMDLKRFKGEFSF